VCYCVGTVTRWSTLVERCWPVWPCVACVGSRVPGSRARIFLIRLLFCVDLVECPHRLAVEQERVVLWVLWLS
jgi:hypothetical protein